MLLNSRNPAIWTLAGSWPKYFSATPGQQDRPLFDTQENTSSLIDLAALELPVDKVNFGGQAVAPPQAAALAAVRTCQRCYTSFSPFDNAADAC